MKKKFFLFCIAGIISCGKRDLPQILTGGSYRYWQIITNHNYQRKDSAYFYFDKYGKYIIFINKENNMHELDGGDTFYTPLWKWNDSIFVISNNSFYIKELKDNSILIKSTDKDYVDTLEAVPLVKIPMRYRHYYNGPTRYIPEAIR